MAKKTQNVNLLMECAKRFSQKPWYSVDWLNALMGRLAFLNDDEVNLILDLTESFHYLGLNDFNSMLHNAFNKIPVNRLNAATRILFAPLKSPYYTVEEKKWRKRLRAEGWNGQIMAPPSKSCDFIFRIMQIDYPVKYQPYAGKIVICTTPQDVESNFIDGTLVVLWDDFVGSGETAFTAIAGIQHYLYVNGKTTHENNYVVVSMCAMQGGIDILQYFNLDCFADNVYAKAISDDIRYSAAERAQRIAFMQSAEKKVVRKALKEYSLGFEQSEAILSIMDRCPNNTFPIYWFKSQHNVAPIFYRQK
jgi:hypothetical protein